MNFNDDRMSYLPEILLASPNGGIVAKMRDEKVRANVVAGVNEAVFSYSEARLPIAVFRQLIDFAHDLDFEMDKRGYDTEGLLPGPAVIGFVERRLSEEPSEMIRAYLRENPGAILLAIREKVGAPQYQRFVALLQSEGLWQEVWASDLASLPGCTQGN